MDSGDELDALVASLERDEGRLAELVFRAEAAQSGIEALLEDRERRRRRLAELIERVENEDPTAEDWWPGDDRNRGRGRHP